MIMKLPKYLLFVLLFFVSQSVLTAQSPYIIKYKGTSYVFTVTAKTDYFVIRYQSKADSLLSLYKSDDLRAVVAQLTQSEVYEKLADSLNTVVASVSDKLQDSYFLLQNTHALQSHVANLESDKESNIALLKLKKTTANAYLLRKTERAGSRNNALSLSDNKKKNYDIAADSTKKWRRTVFVQSIDIAFENGVIKDLLVRALDSLDNRQCYFSNMEYIPIRNGFDIDRLATKNRHFVTFQYDRVQTLALDLSDVLDYNRQITSTSGTYIPKDTTVSFDGTQMAMVKLYKPSIAQSFDIRLFTDALGYSGKTPNGIVQLEAQINFYLNQGKKFRSLNEIRTENNPYKYRSQQVWLNRISPYFRLSKLEDTRKCLNVSNFAGNKLMLELYKYANLDFGTDLNLLTCRTDSKLFAFNMAAGFLRTSIGKDSTDASSVYIHPYVDLKFFDSNKIDFNLGVGGYLAWRVSSVDPIHIQETLHNGLIRFFCNHSWLNLSQSVNLHPGGNKQSSVFIRATQYVGVYNSYFTFQIGYSTSISNLLNF
jgi:hypothetical protein